MNYSSTVIPIILAVWFASHVQKLAKKFIPEMVQLFLVPFFTLIITVPITFLVIGPVASWASDALSALFQGIFNFSPILAALLMGGFWQVFVMFGVHWGFVAVFYAELASQGFDQILLLSVSVCFAQIGVVLGIMLQTKDPKTKALAIPCLYLRDFRGNWTRNLRNYLTTKEIFRTFMYCRCHRGCLLRFR